MAQPRNCFHGLRSGEGSHDHPLGTFGHEPAAYRRSDESPSAYDEHGLALNIHTPISRECAGNVRNAARTERCINVLQNRGICNRDRPVRGGHCCRRPSPDSYFGATVALKNLSPQPILSVPPDVPSRSNQIRNGSMEDRARSCFIVIRAMSDLGS